MKSLSIWDAGKNVWCRKKLAR